MEGTVEQREGSAFARARESRAFTQAIAPLDVRRRQRAQRP
jgi:hypothetical protein